MGRWNLRKSLSASFFVSGLIWSSSFLFSYILLGRESFEFESIQNNVLPIDFENQWESFLKISLNNVKVQLLNFTGSYVCLCRDCPKEIVGGKIPEILYLLFSSNHLDCDRIFNFVSFTFFERSASFLCFK